MTGPDQARVEEACAKVGATRAGSYSPLPRTANVKAKRKIKSRISIPNATRSRTSSPLSNANRQRILTESGRPVRRTVPAPLPHHVQCSKM